jgi:tRNA pseudouridine65 synthase
MLLHARRITLRHPVSGDPLVIEAPLDEAFNALLARFGWSIDGH